MSEQVFDEEWPDGCPPQDAQDAQGPYYRLARTNPPSEADFRTYAELGLRPDADLCMRCGLSIYSTYKGAVEMQKYMKRRSPGVNLGDFVACLELTSANGRVKQTNRPPHHTWWRCSDTEPMSVCRETFEIGRDV